MSRISLFLCIWICSALLPESACAQAATVAAYDSVRVNGITLAYRVLGDGDPLVLLHGFGGTGANWDAVLDELSPHHRLIVPDLRGHGRSTSVSHYLQAFCGSSRSTLIGAVGMTSRPGWRWSLEALSGQEFQLSTRYVFTKAVRGLSCPLGPRSGASAGTGTGPSPGPLVLEHGLIGF